MTIWTGTVTICAWMTTISDRLTRLCTTDPLLFITGSRFARLSIDGEAETGGAAIFVEVDGGPGLLYDT